MTEYSKDVCVIIVNRNRPDLTDDLVEQIKNFDSKYSSDIYVVELGSSPDNFSKYASVWYEDEDFSGKAFGHHVGLEYVRSIKRKKYRYYWFLMNDLVFKKEQMPIDTLIDILKKEKRMGLISPTEINSGYPDSKPQEGREWHMVSTTDYLAVMVKEECLDEVGFFNPDFKYCWGAIHELSHKMYKANWFIAYCDNVIMTHLGGTTYGKAKNTISREEYVYNAKKWAYEYFIGVYGKNWVKQFTEYLPDAITANTYEMHEKYWGTYKNKK